ncbi:MAG: TetR/AcrR family transcriptional regulator [Pseudomonadota bacterium]
MSISVKKDSPWPERETAIVDGRRQRSDRSRQRIIEALFDLISEGEMSPNAASVAKRARVGLRTVFRHFEDLDRIYDEMTDALITAILPKVVAPYQGTTWQDRLMECIDRRADIYETVFPLRVSMMLRIHQSEFIRQQYKRDLTLERSSLKAILPASIASDTPLFAALEVTLGFPTWRKLRQDQSRSPEAAKEIVRLMVTRLIANENHD